MTAFERPAGEMEGRRNRGAPSAPRQSRRLVLVLLAGAMMIAAPCGAIEEAGTFSIVALDPETGEIGVAVESRAFSVGSAVSWAEAGVGAIATQSQTNESFGPRGLDLMRAGRDAGQTLRELLAPDAGRESRQVGIVDAKGGSISHTGTGCSPWAGDTTAPGIAIQGNILAGPEVVSAMLRAFRETRGELAERLIATLKAGQAAGGDRRGQQSAALLVVRPSDLYPEYRTRYVDLRVEDHPAPIDELERIFRIHQVSDLLQAHTRYAALYDSLGQQENARRERERIGETLSGYLSGPRRDAQELNSLAWFCALGNVHMEEALRAAQLAVELEPESAEIIDTLAEVYFRMGRREEALSTIERAIRLAPEDPYLLGQRERFRR